VGLLRVLLGHGLMNVFRSLLLVAVSLVSVPALAQEPWVSRLAARHSIGDGVGYEDGFTSVDWFLPLLPDGDNDLWFADFRGLVSNDSEFSSNVGSGYRWYTPNQNRIYGFNAYWDTRQFDGFAFNQAGVGFETLGECIDFEANAYTPAVNDTNHRNLEVLEFAGNDLLIQTINALSGADFLLGYNIPAMHEFHTRVLGGGYYFDSSETADAAGWRVKLETAFRDWLSVSAVAQEDDLFGRNVSVSIELRKPIEHKSNAISSSMRHMFRSHTGGHHDDTIRHRLADPVQRQQQIALTIGTENATDMASAPLTFIHVVPGVAGTGNGTFEDPYGTITDAMDDLPLAETSIVYTPQGGTFTEPVTLASGTELRSNGPSQVINSLQGPLTLPFSGSSGDDLTALSTVINGDVDLKDNTLVHGFAITGTVSGNDVTSATVDTSRISQPATDAITLINSTEITLINLLIDQSGRGIFIENNGGTDLTVSVQQSSITSAGHAFSAVAASGSDLTVAIANSTATSTAGTGFMVDGSAGTGTTFVSQFQDNTVAEADTGGVIFTDVIFDAVSGGAPDPVSFSSLLVGSATARVTGNGISFTDTVGDVDMGNVNIFNETGSGLTGSGLFVSNSPTLTLSSQAGSTIDTIEGPALNLSDVETALVFDSVVSVDSSTEAAAFNTVKGALSVTTTVMDDAFNPPFRYEDILNPFTVSFGDTTIKSLQGSGGPGPVPDITLHNEVRVGNLTGLPAAGTIYSPLFIYQ